MQSSHVSGPQPIDVPKCHDYGEPGSHHLGQKPKLPAEHGHPHNESETEPFDDVGNHGPCNQRLGPEVQLQRTEGQGEIGSRIDSPDKLGPRVKCVLCVYFGVINGLYDGDTMLHKEPAVGHIHVASERAR